MKLASWNECLEGNCAYSITPDHAKAKSLSETSQERMKFLKSNKITEANANFIFEGVYTSVLEILHALVLKKGFKVDNHLCLGFYLRDVLEKEGLYRVFDDLRYKRNSLVYYGKRMDFETAKQSVEKARKLINELMMVK